MGKKGRGRVLIIKQKIYDMTQALFDSQQTQQQREMKKPSIRLA